MALPIMHAVPIVSVIIPVYNGARYLAAAIESVLAQTVKPDEIIVVDDGSTDATPAIMVSYRKHIIGLNQANRGAASAMNRGVAAATGTLLAFLDADDLWEPNKTEIQLCALVADPSLDAVFGLVHQFVSPELDTATAARFVCPAGPQRGVGTSTMMIRRNAFLHAGPFEETLQCNDFAEWYPRAVDAGFRSVVMPTVVARRRLHGANTGVRLRDQQRAGKLDLIKRMLDRRRTRLI